MQNLILQHLEDMLNIPETILRHLQQGGFTVSILGRPCHSIGIDEAHEMCINRERREFITRPSADYINRTAQFLSIRATAMTKLEAQVFAERKDTSKSQMQAVDPESKRHETNVQCQIKKRQFYSMYSQGPHSYMYNTISTTNQSIP